MSDKTSCISHPPKSIFVMIRIDYMAICQGSPDAACSAALLSYFENWMNTKLDNRPQAKLRNQIDKAGGKPSTQDESLWVYISQDELKKDLLGVFGDTKINACLQWLRNVGYLSCRENPEHRWDRKLQYMLNVEIVQALLNDMASHGEFNIKLSKASKKPLKRVKKDTREGENNEAIAKNVLDSQLDSELEEKDSSALRSEDTPIISDADSDSHKAPEAAKAVDEPQASNEPVLESEEAKTASAHAVEESSEAVASGEAHSDPDPIAPEELEAADNSDIVRKAEEFVEEVAKKLDPYQEVVRRAFAPVGQPLTYGWKVTNFSKFLRGQFLKGDKRVGKKQLDYQLSDRPMNPAEIAGLTLWYRPKYNQPHLPTTLDTLRERCDEFFALHDFAVWVEKGQKIVEQLMSGQESKLEDKPKSRVANAQKPLDESDMQAVDWDEEDKKYEEGKRERQATPA